MAQIWSEIRAKAARISCAINNFELVVNPVSMEEAVQQQLEVDGEFEGDPGSNNQSAAETKAPDSENDNVTPEARDNTVEMTEGNVIAALQYRGVKC